MKYKGKLLVSKPILTNPFFEKVVVIIAMEDENGTTGLVLNKPLKKKLSYYMPDLKSNMEVYLGGPVNQENLYFIHTRPDLIRDSIKINETYYWSGNYDDVKKAINLKLISKEEIRFYLGYSGWSTNQLSDELENKDWFLATDETIDYFQGWERDLWRQVLLKLDENNIIWVNAPQDPQWN